MSFVTLNISMLNVMFHYDFFKVIVKIISNLLSKMLLKSILFTKNQILLFINLLLLCSKLWIEVKRFF